MAGAIVVAGSAFAPPSGEKVAKGTKFAVSSGMERRSLFAIAAVAMLLSACAGNINPSRQVDDAALAASVRQALQNDPALKPYTIYVSADQGVITLTGSVRTPELRDRAGSVAQSVPNVVRIDNRMTVQ